MNLNKITENDFKLVGSKAFALSKLTKVVNVPSGFVVSSVLFSSFIESNNIQTLIDNQMGILLTSKKNNQLIENASIKIKEAFLKGKFNEQDTNIILNEYLQLNNKSVAVRSSSTSEDLNNSSYAGQYDSFLNVDNVTDLFKFIKLVFASLYSTRAITYRQSQNDYKTPIMPVLVQTMVDNSNSSAGVSFGLDLDDGNKDIIYTNASYGMCEMIVSGQTVADEIKVNKSDLSILELTIETKIEKMVNNVIVDVEEKNQKIQSISNENIFKLSKEILKIESVYGKPMDVEWVIDNHNELFIVQARPITIF